jgi:PKD repeat protein
MRSMFDRIRRCLAHGVCVPTRAGSPGPIHTFTASFLVGAAFLAFTATAWADTVEKRVVTSSDDAEEATSDGTVYLNSSDLELTFDASINTNQVVGMRFTGLAIPPGAIITTAWIQFTAKEAQSETTTVLIQAQAADTASTFTTTPNSISTRPRTAAGVTWIPVPWTAGQTTAAQQTPNFKSVIQQVVNRPGWALGNPLVIIITGTGHRTPYSFDGTNTQCPLLHVEFTPGTNPVATVSATQLVSPAFTVRANGSASVAGSGGAIASYTFNWGDGTANTTTTAPTATAQHTYSAAGSRTITLTVSDAVGHVSAPATTTINVQQNTAPVAHLSVTQLATPALTVRGDGSTSTDTDYAPIASYTFNWGDGTANSTATAPTATAQHSYASAGTYTVTLTATDAGGLTSAPATQSITVAADNPPVAQLGVTQLASPPLTVSASGAGSSDTDSTPIASYRFTFGDGTAAVVATAPNNSAQHTYAAAGTYTVTLTATDTGGLTSAPASSSITVTPPAGGTTTVEKRVATSADDAEEETSNSSVYLNSSDLELTFDTSLNSTQVVGMRWTGFAVPQGASITAAYIQYGAKEAQSEVTTLAIRGQAADTAAIFVATSGSVSARPRTTASVPWTPVAWNAGELGPNQRTPDLSPVIQEIVSRPGWKSGNPLAIIITGTGHRTAWSYDGNPVQAPLLHVEYGLSGAPTAQLALTPAASPPYTVQADGSGSSATDGKTVTGYQFNWGDGTAATNTSTATANHTYANPGTYTVSLVVTDSGNRSSAPATRSITFAAEAPPTAHVTATQRANPALTVRADGSTSTDPDATPIASYSVTFGDNSAPVVINAPTTTCDHTYANPGTYTVTLIATDTGGLASQPATASITVQAEQIPVARLSVAQLVPTPALTVRADGSTSTDPDFTPIASYTFDWGDGTTNTTTTAPTATAQHTYAAAGTYSVKLIATDTGGNASTQVTQSINVIAENAPTAQLTATQLVTPALTVRADASTSSDTDLTPIASYRFTFGDGTAAVTTTAPNAIAQHTYGAAGTYTVTLTATDTGGNTSAPVTQSINVMAETPPTARLTATQVANPATTVSADASTSTDADMTPIASYRFDWGDGTTPTNTTAPTATAQHTYANPGNFTVTVVVTDNVGNASAPATATVPVLGRISLDKRIAASSDDAEQTVSSGSVSITSSALELAVKSNAQQIIGLRWAGITIPKGATISNAYIQFTSSTSTSGTVSLSVAGQAADNAATFTTSTSSISTRTKTGATVAWVPSNAWSSGQAGTDQRTPDLTAIIQEIVNRTNWASGNALALIISGTGTRTAYSYDGNAASAALLHIEYLGTGTGPTAKLTASQTGSLTARADGSTSTAGDSPIASYRFDWGDGTTPTTVTAPTSAANHTYASAGTYTVTLIVTDTAGRPSAPVTASVTVSQATSGPISVYVGYYDTHHTEHLRTKPSPWYGSSGITFVGTPDSGSGGWDSSGIRIDNPSAAAISVTVTVDMGSSHFGLWGARTVPAGGTLVLAQTGFENFDGSDTNPAGCYGCNPNLCTTQVQSTVPVVHVTMNGTTTNYYDSGQISNTHGVDMAGCPDTGGTRNDESQVWTQIFSQAPLASAIRAREESGPAPAGAPARALSFAPVFPNPARMQLTLRYTIPSQQDVEIGIFDIAGRRVQSHLTRDLPPGEYQSALNLSGIPSGMYYCSLRVGDQMLRQRFVHVQ